jgi:hypothetical protein
MQIYGISFMHPYKAGRWQYVLHIKHVEDTIIKFKLIKNCAFFLFLLRRYITMHGTENEKFV